jgi:hypothetical protein
MINFTRAFDLAWERMVVILFSPFNLGKWFAIGLSAFLAGLMSGGNGFSGAYNNRNDFDRNWSVSYSSNLNHLNTTISSAIAGLQAGFGIFIFAVGFLLALGVILLVYWLSSRGQFLFLDNVVRNRGAISWPWRNYARLGNSLFVFYLVYLLIATVIFLPLIAIGIVVGLPLLREHRWPEGAEIPLFILFGVIYLAISLAFNIVLFLFRELGVPLMFRHGFRAWEAFRQTWALMRLHPGPLVLFVLLRVALFLALIVVSIIVCCLSCCIGALPYFGTILLLPALVYIKCFTLDFLAQFGPEYDVWTVDVPLNLPPPPG